MNLRLSGRFRQVQNVYNSLLLGCQPTANDVKLLLCHSTGMRQNSAARHRTLHYTMQVHASAVHLISFPHIIIAPLWAFDLAQGAYT